jgi:hypothetical protein
MLFKLECILMGNYIPKTTPSLLKGLHLKELKIKHFVWFK